MKELRAIEIELNSHCNRTCSYCPNSVSSRIEQGVMPLDRFEYILHQLSEINFQGRISFSFYNEPLLLKNLTEYVQLLKKILPQTHLVIYSNGTLLTCERFYDLVAAGVDCFILTKHENENEYIAEKTIRDLPEDFVSKYIKHQTYLDLKLTNRGGNLNLGRVLDKNIGYPCLVPMHVLTITNKGSVVPCFEDYKQVHVMGNIFESSLESIWNLPTYIEFRKKLVLGMRSSFEVCSKCNRIETLGIY